LHIAQVPTCYDHIASPDVHVDHDRRQIRMYFHGPWQFGPGQKSFAAISSDGIHFEPRKEVLGDFYLRMIPWRGAWIGMAKGGIMYESEDGLTKFRCLPRSAFPKYDAEANQRGSVRHVALQIVESALVVYFTRIGDAPECILRSQIDLTNKKREEWIGRRPALVLRPERPWEGADLSLRPSTAGASEAKENAVRDPAIFQEGGRSFLLYSVAGEAGIAIAELCEERS
jgi:hypothetical protein